MLGVVPGQRAPPNAGPEIFLAPGSADRWRHLSGDAVAHVTGPDGKDLALVRAWCPEVGRDLLGYERTIAALGPAGLRLVGFDVDRDPTSGVVTVAAAPPPTGAELIITPPVP